MGFLTNDLIALSLITLFGALALSLRLHNIEVPAHVVWDETHFGKFVGYYINRTFFFDVHPPLGKLLLTAAGSYAGYQADFGFEKPGDPFVGPEYISMRMLPAFAGSLVVSIVAAMSWELTNSLSSTFLVGMLLLTDTALTTISRYILFDPFFIVFMAFSAFCYIKAKKTPPLSSKAWLWFSLTGLSLGCCMSTKFVAIFIIIHIGLSVLYELYEFWKDNTIDFIVVIQQFLLRLYTLVGIPICTYMFVYVVHFVILSHSGPGDGFHSSAFQSTLLGNPLFHAQMPEYVSYGATVRLKQTVINGNYLHSHRLTYPEKVGLLKQQVTGYTHRDTNNLWMILSETKDNFSSIQPSLVKNDEIVLLQHQNTEKYLSVIDFNSALTSNHYLLGCETRDKAAPFRVEVIDNVQRNGYLGPLFTSFKLISVEFECVLESKHKKLPKWGSEQSEMTCNPHPQPWGDTYHHWIFEYLKDDRMEGLRVDWKDFNPGFWTRFVEVHKVMLWNNNLLKPKTTRNSRPWMWPIAWDKETFSSSPLITLTGNVIVYWFILCTLFITLLAFLITKIQRLRMIAYGLTPPEFDPHWKAIGWAFQAWLLHYLPFWTMTRVLYSHHYIPAFIWSALLAGIATDKFFKTFFNDGTLKVMILAVISITFACSFVVQSQFVYGEYDTLFYSFRKTWIAEAFHTQLGSYFVA